MFTEPIRSRIVIPYHSNPHKGAEMMMYSAVLLRAEVKALQEANRVKKRREREQKRCITEGGSLTIQEGEELAQRGQIEVERIVEEE